MPSKRYVNIGLKIKQAREEKGITQQELARLLGSSSVTIGNWEKARRKVSLDDLEQIAVLLDKPLDYFIDGDSANISDILNNLQIKILPVLATVPAGKPIMTSNNIEEYQPVPLFLANDADFMIRVKGDSMIERGIFDKDYLLVRRQDYANNGDIVVVLVGDEFEATIKRFYLEGNIVRLEPANGKYRSVEYSKVRVVGKVVGSYRKY